MRPLAGRLISNIRRPGQLYRWWIYQNSRANSSNVYLVTLPSSGTHWMRTMLAKAMVEQYALPDKIDVISDYHLVPTFRDKSHRFKYNDRPEIPRIQHSHAYYSWLFRRGRVLLMVRDLRDALVSHYRTYAAMKDPDISFGDFLRGRNVRRPGQKNNHTLLTLVGFMNSWTLNRHKLASSIVVKYEDMRKNESEVLVNVLEFCGFGGVDDKLIYSVIEFASIENMRKIDNANPLPQYQDKVQKIRDGLVGKYDRYFSEDDKVYFKEIVKSKLHDSLGYDYTRW